ncbi:TPA: hypothetical protein DD455_03720, partial [Candidatus Shapirobacteria bacterium]|nr:hypothetical protein [Candidatus Shapirobacteria bacterium]
YFNYFSPQFLLTQGDWQNPRHSAPYTGVLLIPSVVFLIIGIFKYLSGSKKTSLSRFFLFWLFLAPIPAALTRDEIQATRIMNFSLPLCYFAALGLVSTLNYLKKNNPFYLFVQIFIFIFYLISFTNYADLYFNHMVKKSPQEWLFGYKEAIDYVVQNKKDHQVYFTPFYGQPYIYYLFYTKYPPQKYQAQAELISQSIDTGSVYKIDDIIFDTPDIKFIQLQSSRVLAIYPYDETVRQAADLSKLIPISPINFSSTFYGYKNP